jgi:glutamate dehydrogenase
LDRQVEGLPSTAEMAQFKQDGRPLTRPEIAVLMAWTKIVLFDDIVASRVPDDPYFQHTLQSYFPSALKTYSDVMQAHRLKREIISTVLANRIIDIAGPIFMLRLREQTGASNADIVEAFEAAYALLDAATLRGSIDQLDNQVPASRQMALHASLAGSLARYTHGLLSSGQKGSIVQIITALAPNTDALSAIKIEGLPAYLKAVLQRRAKHLSRDGVPDTLANQIVRTSITADAPLMRRLSQESAASPDEVTAAYITIGDTLSLDRLRAAAEQAISDMPYWDRLATRGLTRELEALQGEVTKLALKAESVSTWTSGNESARSDLLNDLKKYAGTQPNFAQFALATDAVRKFVQTAE